MGFFSALALGASLLAAAPALADATPGSLSPLGCVGVSGSVNNGPSPCATELPAGLSNVYQALVSPDGRNVYEAVLGNEIAEFSRDPSTGTLTPLDSPSDCVAAPDGGLTTEQCSQQTVSGLNGVAALAVSPDGDNVYAIGQDDNAVVSFARDPGTGVLTQLSGDAACTAETGDTSSSCVNQTGYGLENAYGIAVSPDGLNVYVSSYGDHAVAEFHRDPGSGALSEFACQSDSTFNQGYCTHDADGLENAIGVSVSPDGQDVYVAAGSTSGNGDIAEFSRDTSVPTSSPDYGELSQLPYPDDCITAAANLDPNVQCGDAAATGMNGPEDLTLSPDGQNLYANSFDADAVLEFSRNPSTGVLSQLPAPNDCISSSDASGCGTTDAPSLSGPLGVAISPDGFDLYVADAGSSSVTTLAREPSSGALSALASPDDCVTVNDSGCGTNDVPGLTGARRLTVSPDGANVYVAAQNAPAVVELTRTLPSADLAIAESGAPSAAGVGDSIEYHYTVTNSGPSDADDAMLSVQLSAASVLDFASGSQGACAGTATVLCDLGLLRSGDSATVDVKVELPSAGTSTATAGVLDATDVADPNTANNSVLSSTSVGMGDGTGLYVTQREISASANVASFTLGSFDDSLSAPAFAGAGGAGSFGIAVTPDGAHVYVTNDNGGDSISQYSVDPSTGALTPLTPATVTDSQTPGSNPEDIAVDPTGRWVYVANPFGPSVSQLRIDPSTGALTMVNEFTSGLLTFPTGVAFSPDGKSLYVADYGSGNVVEFDVDPLTGALTPKSTAIMPLPEPPGGTTPEPRRLVTAAVGGNDYLYVSDYANAQVDQFTIDPASGELTADAGVSSGAGPTGLAVDTATSPQSLYVAAEADGVVDEYDIDLSTGSLAAKASPSISSGAGPGGVALAPDDQELYVGDSGDSNLNLYTIAADGTLAADPTNPQVAAGSGPSTPVLSTLPAPPVAPPTPTGGALTQLAAPNDCLTGNLFGCNTLIAPSGALNADYQTVVSPDGKNVYAAAYLGLLVEFSRDPSTGALTEIGCVSDGDSACASDDAAGSNNPRSLALSPDGDYLYEVGADNELVTFSRDPSTGLLTWIGCLDAPSSADSRCSATANGLEGLNGVAVSPDGTSVYVTANSTASDDSGEDSSIAWFQRDPSTGLLTQSSGSDCISSDNEDTTDGCAIEDADGLTSPVTVAVSPDSKNVYVSAGGLGPGGDVAEFSRDPASGALTQLASPDDCLSSPGAASCANTSGVGFGGEEDIAISPDGRSVYLNSFSNSAVIELQRDPSTGVLTQLAAPNDCITSDSSNPGGCGSVSAAALNGVQGVAVSPDGLDVYAASSGPVVSAGASNAVDEFQRNPITGALTQAPAPFECLTENGSGCSTYNVNGLGQPRRLSISPDGLNVYAAGQEGTLVELARTPPSADLSIEQSGAATAANVGDPITYSYTIHDFGPSAVDDAVVSVPLDSKETLTSASSSQGSCSGSATVSCDLGPMLAGGQATVTVTAVTTSSGTASVDATVADATDVTDPNTSNNDVTASTGISEDSPTNSTLPTITGAATAQQGVQLSATNGTWANSPTSFTYQWEQCDGAGNNCQSLGPAATSQTYTPASTDVGITLRVTVTAVNAGGNAPATSTETAVVLIAAPTNSTLPSITGAATAQQGVLLSATNGTWVNSPTSFTYQWEQCDGAGNNCQSLGPAATSQTYTPASADVGNTLRVIVTAINAGGDASATSFETAVVLIAAPTNSTLPSITGAAAAQQGVQLTATNGTWANSPANFTYQWEQCDGTGSNCASLGPAAMSQTYTPASTDVGSTLRVTVTASNGGGDASATSSETAVVLIGAPTNSTLPTITGAATAQQGVLLSATNGTWANSPTSFTYQWESCDGSGNGCLSLGPAAMSQTYTPASTDVGSTLRVTVTAVNAGGNGSATSTQTAVVLIGAPTNSTLPSITGAGTAQQGVLLTATNGTWANSPASFTYQWESCDGSGNGCLSLGPSAMSQTYTPASTDVGNTLRVIVTAINAGGNGAATSAQTAVVLIAAPTNSTPPAITGGGTAQQAVQLTATNGTWANSPASFTYQWEKCDVSGNNCQSLGATATAQSYTPASTDVGSTLRVTVTAINAGGHGSATSTKTATVLIGAPTNSTLPTITGAATAQQGVLLTATNGTWANSPTSFTYQWERCDGSGNGCASLGPSARSQTYTPASTDVGSTLRVTVTASNAGGNGSATSAQTAVVLIPAPTNSTVPSITGAGTAQQGVQLSAANGVWANSPTSFTYQWESCTGAGNNCQSLGATATLQTYTPASTDVGSTLRVIVTAINAGGHTPATSTQTAVVLIAAPTNSTVPTITGAATAQQGVQLTATNGTWANSPASFTYQWEQCDGSGNNCLSLGPAATSQTYTPASTDVGSTLRVTVTASNAGGHGSATSAQTATVVIGVPTNNTLPTVTGAATAQQGVQLAATNGTWANSPTSFTYQWESCDGSGNGCVSLGSTATSQTYTPASTDVGNTLRVTVTAVNAGGNGSATSTQTATVLIAAPVNTQLPAISGITGQGQLLSISNGVWANTPLNFSYQWQQCDATGANCSSISKATAGDYVAQPGDVGHTLRVVVTASNAGGGTAATTAQSAIIGTLPANNALPTVSGVASQDQMLTSANGTWAATPAPTFTYQWEQCDGMGNNCSTIAGAIAAGYAPVSGDVGHTLRAQVIASNTAGSTTATSAATAAILVAAPTDSALPAVSGTAQSGQTLSASTGTWSNTPTGFGYQWSQCDSSGNACAPIATATSASYLTGPGDVGHTLRVTVTATNAGGPGQATSSQSQVVSSPPPPNTAPPTNSGPTQQGQTIAPPSNTALPLISGTAQQGQMLTLSDGTWANSPSSFAYQWLRCNGAGANCAAIAAATGDKYVPVSADGGHTLRATVTASNAGGATAATAIKTAVVSSLQVSVAAPILGQTSNLAPVNGTVLIRLPGSKTFTRLTSAIDLPMGSTIDARKGKVTLTVALPHGGTQTGQFYDGEFVLTQASSGMTILTLTGASFAGCPAASTSATTNGATGSAGTTTGGATGSAGTTTGGASTKSARASAAKKKPTTVVRQLWGNAHGDYTTKGRYGSATVSGTVWLTEDRCDGTYVKVTKDNVIVVAYAHPHTKHNIQQGHQILIPAPVH